jgi:hypothetical protein
MFALPCLGLLIGRELSLLLAKSWRMNRPATVEALPRNALVKHFVEDDVLDDIVGHKGLVKGTMHPDYALVWMVRAKTYRRTWASGGMMHPGDGSLELVGEERVIQRAIDGCKVEVTSLWLELWQERLTG